MAKKKKKEVCIRYLNCGYGTAPQYVLKLGGSTEPWKWYSFIWYIDGLDVKIIVDTSVNIEDHKALTSEPFMRKAKEDPLVQLKKLGVKPEDVDIVILTHCHYDHIGYLDKFPNASIIIQRDEVKIFSAPPKWYPETGPFTPKRFAAVVDKLEVVNGDYKVVEGVEVWKVGGHTPGCQAVLVDTPKGRVCLASDNIFWYENLEEKWPIGEYHNLDEVVRFMEEVPMKADIIIPGHDGQVIKKYPKGVIP